MSFQRKKRSQLLLKLYKSAGLFESLKGRYSKYVEAAGMPEDGSEYSLAFLIRVFTWTPDAKQPFTDNCDEKIRLIRDNFLRSLDCGEEDRDSCDKILNRLSGNSFFVVWLQNLTNGSLTDIPKCPSKVFSLFHAFTVEMNINFKKMIQDLMAKSAAIKMVMKKCPYQLTLALLFRTSLPESHPLYLRMNDFLSYLNFMAKIIDLEFNLTDDYINHRILQFINSNEAKHKKYCDNSDVWSEIFSSNLPDKLAEGFASIAWSDGEDISYTGTTTETENAIQNLPATENLWNGAFNLPNNNEHCPLQKLVEETLDDDQFITSSIPARKASAPVASCSGSVTAETDNPDGRCKVGKSKEFVSSSLESDSDSQSASDNEENRENIARVVEKIENLKREREKLNKIAEVLENQKRLEEEKMEKEKEKRLEKKRLRKIEKEKKRREAKEREEAKLKKEEEKKKEKKAERKRKEAESKAKKQDNINSSSSSNNNNTITISDIEVDNAPSTPKPQKTESVDSSRKRKSSTDLDHSAAAATAAKKPNMGQIPSDDRVNFLEELKQIKKSIKILKNDMYKSEEFKLATIKVVKDMGLGGGSMDSILMPPPAMSSTSSGPQAQSSPSSGGSRKKNANKTVSDFLNNTFRLNVKALPHNGKQLPVPDLSKDEAFSHLPAYLMIEKDNPALKELNLQALTSTDFRYLLRWGANWDSEANEKLKHSLRLSDDDIDVQFYMNDTITKIYNKLSASMEANQVNNLTEMIIFRLLSQIKEMSSGSFSQVSHHMNFKKQKTTANEVRETMTERLCCVLCQSARVQYGWYNKTEDKLVLKFCSACLYKEKATCVDLCAKDAAMIAHGFIVKDKSDLDKAFQLVSYGGKKMSIKKGFQVVKKGLTPVMATPYRVKTFENYTVDISTDASN